MSWKLMNHRIGSDLSSADSPPRGRIPGRSAAQPPRGCAAAICVVAVASVLGLAVSAWGASEFNWNGVPGLNTYAASGYEDFVYSDGSFLTAAAANWMAGSPAPFSARAAILSQHAWIGCPKSGGVLAAATKSGTGIFSSLPYPGINGKILVGVRLEAGNDCNPPDSTGKIWGIEAYDDSGNRLAAFEGTWHEGWGTVGSTQYGGTYTSISTGVLSQSSYTPAWMIIDTSTQQVEFFYSNGTSAVSMGTLTYASGYGTSLGKIQLTSNSYPWTDTWPRMNLDNMTFGALSSGPTVTIDQAAGQADPTSTSPINFTVVFSDTVADFATGDVTLGGTAGATTATVTEIAPNDGTTYNVEVSGMTTNGSVIASIASGAAHGSGGDPNFASTSTDNQVTWQGSPTGTLEVKLAGSITIDGDPSDWNLSGFTTAARGGMRETGDYALTGWDGGTWYEGNHAPGLQFPPTDRADHTFRVWSQHDADYQYFLVRVDDSDIWTTSGGQTDNWKNDSVEFYIDPGHDGGSVSMITLGNTSTSDIQLVIDAANQKNIYMCTDAYRDSVLLGVTSAVWVPLENYEGYAGWWLEVRIAKNALSPAIPADGTFGVEFNVRDNDNNNDPTVTSVYDWNDPSSSGFPSKIPDHWGKAINMLCSAPLPPTSASAEPSGFCAGDSGDVTLTASGGSGDTLVWYADGCGGGGGGGTLVGTGTPLVVPMPSVTTTYHARWEAASCGSSSCASATVTLNPGPDSDGDGVGDLCDQCPNTVPGASVDAVGCPPPIPFDFDRDGDVDTAVDYAKFEACSTGPAIAGPPEGCTTEEFGLADVDGDGDVDQADFAVFERCYSGTDKPADPNCSQ